MNSYPISKADDPKAVGECKYGIGATVTMTKFTSCTGLFCKLKDKDEIIGLHLVLFDGKDYIFSIKDVPKVQKILEDNNADLSTGWIVGCLDFWPKEILDAFIKMLANQQIKKLNGIYTLALRKERLR